MNITQKQQDEIQILEVSGELDFHSTPQLREKMQEMADKQQGKIVVNLKQVSYIDSSGLATFVELLQKVKRYNGKLILADLAPAVRGVFEIAKLDSVFELVGTQDEALARLN